MMTDLELVEALCTANDFGIRIHYSPDDGWAVEQVHLWRTADRGISDRAKKGTTLRDACRELMRDMEKQNEKLHADIAMWQGDYDHRSAILFELRRDSV